MRELDRRPGMHSEHNVSIYRRRGRSKAESDESVEIVYENRRGVLQHAVEGLSSATSSDLSAPCARFANFETFLPDVFQQCCCRTKSA